MDSSGYDKGILETYRFPAASLIGGAAVVGRFIGPKGKTGRVVNLSHIVTTGVTVAAASVTVGENGATNPISHTVPISSAGAGVAVARSTFLSQPATDELPADTVVEVATGGEATAGAADLVVSVNWY